MNKFIFTQEEAAFLDPALLGGKAANLAWMSRESLPVPRWWVISTQAFTEQLADLSEGINQQLATLNDPADTARVDALSAHIRERILALPLSARLSVEIKTTLGQTVEQGFYAVRSSVLGEDAAGASFAGQMDSYLFQRGQASIIESIKKVFASAFNTRALQYRLTKGIALTDIRAAVIVQEMIEGDVSGVMFTAHPINGNRQQMLISAAWGTGEGIVSGICNTDEFTVGHSGNFIEKIINEKDCAIVFDTDKGLGTREVTIDAPQSLTACLDDATVLALRDMGNRIAQLKRYPQDIEWAVCKGEVFILQTRPITRLPAPATPTDKRVVFDNSNIQESYCGVTTPLTFSFANRAYTSVYEQTMRLLGVPEKTLQANRDLFANLLGLVRGRVYYNINNWYRALLFLPAFKTNKADMERMMGLQDPVDLVEDKKLGLWQKLALLPQLFGALFRLQRGFRRMDKLVLEFRTMFDRVYHSVPRAQLHTQTMGDLFELAGRLERELTSRWTTPIVNDFYVMMMNGRVHRTLEKAGFEHVSVLQNNLLSGEEGIESTEPTKLLLRMCDILRLRPVLRELVAHGKNEALLSQIQRHDDAFYRLCLEYIEKYGDRTIGELKLESITLRQDTSFMFAVLKNFLSRDDLSLATLAANEARFRHEAEEQAFGTIAQKLGNRTLKKFKRDLARLRDAIRNRENMRLARTRTFGLYRDIFLEMGRQFELYGQLDAARDIFYVGYDELWAYYDGRAIQTDLRAMVSSRKAEYTAYEKEDLPHHFWTYGPVYLNNTYVYPFAENETFSTGAEMKGTGCYPGIVEQPIRLIFSPEDELSLNGQILCTVRTDPGWAPLFPTAGGILVERGSTLSHSAVVARELGIPAIVGIPGLTKIVRDQERVRMDGATGTVIRLDCAPAEPHAKEASHG